MGNYSYHLVHYSPYRDTSLLTLASLLMLVNLWSVLVPPQPLLPTHFLILLLQPGSSPCYSWKCLAVSSLQGVGPHTPGVSSPGTFSSRGLPGNPYFELYSPHFWQSLFPFTASFFFLSTFYHLTYLLIFYVLSPPNRMLAPLGQGVLSFFFLPLYS